MTDPLFDSAAITTCKLYTYPNGFYVFPSTPATTPSSGFVDATGGRIGRCAQAVRGVCTVHLSVTSAQSQSAVFLRRLNHLLFGRVFPANKIFSKIISGSRCKVYPQDRNVAYSD